jgi:hypothetical protein
MTNGGEGRNSRIQFVCPKDGDYRIIATTGPSACLLVSPDLHLLFPTSSHSFYLMNISRSEDGLNYSRRDHALGPASLRFDRDGFAS